MAETKRKPGDDGPGKGHEGQGSYGEGGQNPEIGVGQPRQPDEGRNASDDNERDESANPEQRAENTDE